MAAVDKREVIFLYRQLLKLGKRYPSVKRDAIVRDIKLEFKENKELTDPKAIQNKVYAARSGVEELAMYAGLNPSDMKWDVELGRSVRLPSSKLDSTHTSNTKVVGDKSSDKQ